MTLLTIKDLQKKYRQRGHTESSTSSVLVPHGRGRSRRRVFDIFLSHSGLSDTEAAWVVAEINAAGRRVCVDPAAGPRCRDNPEYWDTATDLLASSRCLLYAARSEDDSCDRFLWLSGYFEARTQRVAVLPVFARDTATVKFHGKGILGRYPYAGFADDVTDHEPTVWILKTPRVYVNIEYWLSPHFPGFDRDR